MMGKYNMEFGTTTPKKAECHLSSFKEMSLQDKTESQMKGPRLQSMKESKAPADCLHCFPDHVYVHAAAIFQNACTEKPAAHRLINYSKKTDLPMPPVKDERAERSAYELAFNALKYQELLEDMMIDSCLYLSHPMTNDLMSLVAVMLYDFQDRKFLPREGLSAVGEQLENVRKVESCLFRFRTKLAASLARCRIKRNLSSIDCILPEPVRKRQDITASLPLYAWVNTLKVSLDSACEALERVGFLQADSIGQLQGSTFCWDAHCLDTLVFLHHVKDDLNGMKLLQDCGLVIQDKSCSLPPNIVHSFLEKEADVLVAGAISGFTIAHMAALTAPFSAQVFYCCGSLSPAQTGQLQDIVFKLECKNVKLIQQSFCELRPLDVRLQKTKVILLMPQCSLSAISNPVDFILQENGDKRLLQDLSQGTVRQTRLESLVARQVQDLTHALKFPGVCTVVYCTCSLYPEENEGVIREALKQHPVTASPPPYRLTPPVLPTASSSEEEKTADEKFFKLHPSKQTNGCFVAVLAREPAPKAKETVQEVLARAAAKGLLEGIVPSQPARKMRRRIPRQTAGAHHQCNSRSPACSKSYIEEFLSREAKACSLTSHAVSQGSFGVQCSHGEPDKSKLPCRSLTGIPPLNNSSSQQGKNITIITATAANGKERPSVSNHAPKAPTPSRPSAPTRGRSAVLKPVALVLPPVTFPSFSFFNIEARKPAPSSQSQTLFRGRSSSHLTTSLFTRSLYKPSVVQHPRPWL